jgi:lipopolysaccharide/colanic/teichoic acid biosynthesis glycosyltransferase
VPVLRAYQKRRRGMIKEKFEKLKAKTAAKAEEKKQAVQKKKEEANG